MTNLVTEEAAKESGAAIGLPPVPSLLRDGVVVFSGDANPLGRILALDRGEARYAGYNARTGVRETRACCSDNVMPLMEELSLGLPLKLSDFSISLRLFSKAVN